MATDTTTTVWVCQCCMLSAANGECCDSPEHGGDSREPLSSLDTTHATVGMAWAEHDDECLFRTLGYEVPGDYECECETCSFSTAQCDGCGSFLAGSRHAMTLFYYEYPRPGTMIEKVERANHTYEIRKDHETGLMFAYASPNHTPEPSFRKIGQTQTLQGARLIRRNHARSIERDYR